MASLYKGKLPEVERMTFSSLRSIHIFSSSSLNFSVQRVFNIVETSFFTISSTDIPDILLQSSPPLLVEIFSST